MPHRLQGARFHRAALCHNDGISNVRKLYLCRRRQLAAVFSLLHPARPVLLNLGEPGTFDIAPWADGVQLVDAKYVGPWERPALGPVTAPDAASTSAVPEPKHVVCRIGHAEVLAGTLA
jgi:hypothetical protein